MITRIESYACGRQVYDHFGLSTDTKPTDVTNASTFYEMDTKKAYMFDEQNQKWLEQ